MLRGMGFRRFPRIAHGHFAVERVQLRDLDRLRSQIDAGDLRAAQVLFSASRDQVSDVWVAGRPLVHDGHLNALDLEDVLRRAQYWQARIQESLHSS